MKPEQQRRVGFKSRVAWCGVLVPALNLEVDCVDQRNFAQGQMRTRVEAFIETIVGRRTTSRAARSAR